VVPDEHGARSLPPGFAPDTEFLRHPNHWLLHFSVRDTGIGIPLDRQSRLFKSFQQVDAATTRHYGGTGLGLAISKRLAELMGGRIWVESEAGQGATFHFTISTRAPAAATPPAWLNPQPQLAGRRVLVIEDNPTNRRIISHRGQQWGMKVQTADNRREALALLAQGDLFDAVILDWELPGQEGPALAEQIRKLPSGRCVPLLLLSAMRPSGEDAHPVREGMAVAIHKPIRPAQLLEALCHALKVQTLREKKPPPTPTLDPTLAHKLPLRVLLADDNPINQKVGLSVLSKLGYRADVVSNGREVLETLGQKPYDLLFLDVQMPEMDGLEAARQICQRWPADKRPRIIAMTGNAFVGDREKCLQAGMDDYISKPVRVGDLQSAIERWGPTRPKRSDTTLLARARVIPSEKLLDYALIAELRNLPATGSVGVFQELVDLFLQNAPQRIIQINQSVNDGPMLTFHAHALKGSALNLGATRLAEISQKLEDLGRARNMHGVPALVQELDSVFTQTRAQLLSLRNQ